MCRILRCRFHLIISLLSRYLYYSNNFPSYRYLGNLICVEGIVTRVSLVRPKVVRSVHYCPATKKVMERKYTDLTSFEAFPTTAVYPTKVFFLLLASFSFEFQDIFRCHKVL